MEPFAEKKKAGAGGRPQRLHPKTAAADADGAAPAADGSLPAGVFQRRRAGRGEKNAFSIFREQTANRALDLGNDMVERWSNTREGENDVYAAVGELLDEYGLTAEALLKDSVLCRQLVADTAEHVIAMLRRNGVTGAFLVLDNTEEEGGRPGFYVRDYDPPAMPRQRGSASGTGTAFGGTGRTAWRWTAIGALF